MSESTFNLLISGFMGMFGGMITVSMNGIISALFKREELRYEHELAVTKMIKEKTLQHRMDIELQKMSASNEELAKLKGEVAELWAAVARLGGTA